MSGMNVTERILGEAKGGKGKEGENRGVERLENVFVADGPVGRVCTRQ